MLQQLRFKAYVSFSLVLLLFFLVTGCDRMGAPTDPDLTARSSEDSPPPVSVIADQYIVVLNEEFAPGSSVANEDRAAEIARQLGVAPQHTYGAALFGFAGTIPEGRLNALRSDSRVAYIDRDGLVSLPAPVEPAAPPWERDDGGSEGETLPWGVDRIDADLNAETGSGIHVYIIDTGIDSDHADLQANIGNGYAVEKCKGGGCKEPWDDDHDHGTHVAGTVGAIDNDIDVVGVAPGVTLHAVKVLSKAGFGSRSGVIAGIDWVTSEVQNNGYGGRAAANMSLGGSGSKSGTCDGSGFAGTDSYHNAICNSARAGVVYAVAAGNDGADAENTVPAAYDDAVLTVSATSQRDEWESWSNWGDNSASWTSNVSAPVAIGAPGGNILSTKRGGGTTTMSGTSMAAPHVAGAAALYLASNSQEPGYSAFENTRSGILGAAEDATGFKSEDPNNPHDEDFVDAESL